MAFRKLAERESRVSNAMERLAKEDERYKEIKRAVLLSEVSSKAQSIFRLKINLDLFSDFGTKGREFQSKGRIRKAKEDQRGN